MQRQNWDALRQNVIFCQSGNFLICTMNTRVYLTLK
nr:MAG TPA: hypothetical protein [Caudoviricetes sp.]